MKNDSNHIIICGDKGSGRSSMIRALLRDLNMPVYGFKTPTVNKRPDGFHEIYMFPYDEENLQPSESCHVGDCNGRERMVNNDVFNTLGVKLLNDRGDGEILVMDEIGFMESDAKVFCDAVIDRLNSGVPIIAALKTSKKTEFVDKVLACENAVFVDMNGADFDAVYKELRPIAESWVKAGAA